MCCPCWPRVAEINLPIFARKYELRANPIPQGGLKMKKIAIELLIIAATVMAYVLPVLAEGGGN